MIGDSRPEYILVRSGIFLLRSITPVCFAGFIGGCAVFFQHLLRSEASIPATLGAIIRRHPGYFGLWCYAALESAFFIFVYLPRKKQIQKPAVLPAESSPQERRLLFEQCLATITDTESFLRGWFHGAPIDSLKRDNIVEWATYAVSASDVATSEEMDYYVNLVEAKLGRSFEEGRNEDIKCMRPIIDKVKVVHRPLIYYLVVSGLDFATHLALHYIGFRHYDTPLWFSSFPFRPYTVFSRKSVVPRFSYWHREHVSKQKSPLFFIHGIGIGLLPYIAFLWDLVRADRDVGIIVLEISAINSRLVYPLRQMTPPKTFARDVYSILENHHQEHMSHVIIGVSFGTFLVSQLLAASRRSVSDAESGGLYQHPRICATVLIDPIPFLIFEPDLVHSFLYRVPGSWRANEWMLWYFSSRDIAVAGVLGREFFWHEGVAWRENIVGVMQEEPIGGSPRLLSTLVVLSGKDQIVPAGKVWRYLTNGASDIQCSTGLREDDDKAARIWENDDHSLKVVCYPSLDHAQILASRKKMRLVVARIVQFSARE
ncbi:uncharacterized protein EI90DRAFT_3115609 [Cantharellus anzutake]|uniref:uncharacterized protein n=1 Tax=Cantharellus anzutake TaxID=1750568 RepID=UPI001903CE11|nr:uncharacterized protein EI90DRAFT_3115609 [Cantharellus anzutake]KAF8343122.1 hypothetical protein EI90DRAFT_3115609 [Cantharellus anzutake]